MNEFRASPAIVSELDEAISWYEHKSHKRLSDLSQLWKPRSKTSAIALSSFPARADVTGTHE
jgi:hypothetical protein